MMLLFIGIFYLFSDIVAQQQYACIAGYNWYFLYGQCIPSSPACNIGYMWNGRNCLPAVYCANSTYFNGTSCVDGTNGCPSNFIRWRTFCLNCPVGFNLNTNDQSCFLITDSCANDYYWNGRGCASRISGLISSSSSSSSLSSSSTASSSGSGSGSSSISSGGFLGSSGSSISITGGVQCQTGYYWNGANCILNNGSISCLVGFYWNGFACSSSSVISTNCSEGYYFNGASCIVNDGRINCITGFIWDGFLCKGNQSRITTNNTTITTSTSSSCPAGLVWNGNACVGSSSYSSTSIINCRVGEYFNGQKCLNLSSTIACIPGWTWGGLNCNRISSVSNTTQQNTTVINTTTMIQAPPQPIIQPSQNFTTISTNTTTITSCQPGNYFDGATCKPISLGIICLPGFNFNGTTCLRVTTTVFVPPLTMPTTSSNLTVTNITTVSPLQCRVGQYYNGRICLPLSSSISCEPGYQWGGITCVRSNSSSTINQSTTTTTTTSYTQCQVGLYYNGRQCVQLSSNINCINGYSWNSTLGNCVFSSNQQVTSQPQIQPSIPMTIIQPQPQIQIPQPLITIQPQIQTLQPQIARLVCFDGYSNVNGICQWTGATSCPQGNFFNGVLCVSNTGNIACANGFTWNSQGTECIAETSSTSTTSTITTSIYNNSSNIIGNQNIIFPSIDPFSTTSTSTSTFTIPITTQPISTSGLNLIPITDYPQGTLVMDPYITQPITQTFVTNPIITNQTSFITNPIPIDSSIIPFTTNPIYPTITPSQSFVTAQTSAFPLIQPIDLPIINSNFNNLVTSQPIPIASFSTAGTQAITCPLNQYWNGQQCVPFN